jgi:membrane protein YdbS with pleckstrin-like domain
MAEAPTIADPRRSLAPGARWVWRLYWAGSCVAAGVAGAMVGDALPEGWRPLLWALPLAALLLGTPVVPELRWRRWRWEVREHEVDVRRGTLRVRRTLIPMARIQHVETTRGVLEQWLNLATVQIHTAAGSHTIPLLAARDADELRATIAELSRTEPADG